MRQAVHAATLSIPLHGGLAVCHPPGVNLTGPATRLEVVERLYVASGAPTPPVVYATGDFRSASLMPGDPELAGVNGDRRAELATGRAMARRCLADLGQPPVGIGRLADRSPRWPAGFVGAIAHTDQMAITVVASAGPSTWSIGIDVEPARPLPTVAAETAFTPDELASLYAVAAVDRGTVMMIGFCLKEAAYKAQTPLTGQFADFGDVTLDLGAFADPQRRGDGVIVGPQTRSGAFAHVRLALFAIVCDDSIIAGALAFGK